MRDYMRREVLEQLTKIGFANMRVASVPNMVRNFYTVSARPGHERNLMVHRAVSCSVCAPGLGVLLVAARPNGAMVKHVIGDATSVFPARSGCPISTRQTEAMMEVGTVLAFLLQGAIIASVLALGLNASTSDILYLWHRPGLLLRSFIAMYVVMPLIAVLHVLLLPLPPSGKEGLVLVAISAGAPLLPKTMLKLGCNPPYVYSLLVSTSLAAVLTIPFSLAALSPILPENARESPLSVAVVVARTFLVPLAVGMLVRRLAPLTVDRIRGPVLLVAGLVLVTVLLSLLVLNFSAVLEVDLPSLGAIAIITFAGLAVGHLLGGPEPGNRTCLALASSSRHLGLAAVVAMTNFPEARPLPIVLVFMVVSIVATILYAHWRKKQLAARAAET
jgi:bile acid:Na+ symporter, BASS family